MALRDLEPKTAFAENGYCILRGLFSSEECASYIDHYMELRKEGRPGDFAGVDLTSSDPLKRFPRMIHMHRWDDVSLRWMIDRRLRDAMTALLGEEPLAVQTMLYFKPPGARGQALHQDQFYLRAKPGTCIAAWLALDACDEENGCMQLVPGTHELPILCTEQADTTQSFTDTTVPLAEGMTPIPALMDAGDVLFFNGSVVHGSYPNTSKERFRRALIGHYITRNASEVSAFYHPVLDMEGNQVERGVSPAGSECGVWVDVDGHPIVDMAPIEAAAEDAHE